MPRPFEEVHERLLQAGVAPRHVRRYERELTEHLDDLIAMQRARGYEGEDAQLRARALLGPDEELTNAMLSRGQFRSLSARAPWLVFGVAPLFVIAGLLTGVAFTMVGVWHFGLAGHVPSGARWLTDILRLWCGMVTVATGPLAATFFMILALRQRLPLRWPMVAVLIVAILTAFMTFVVKLPLPHKPGEISVGWGATTPQLWGSLARFCFTTVIAASASFILRARRSVI
jgi:hypothetical protein